METPTQPVLYTIPTGIHPSSPPMTPGAHSQTHFPPQTSHTSPIYKRMGLSLLAQSPPLEFIEPIGQGPEFRFTRPQSSGPPARPSTASSGHARAISLPESEYETESDAESEDDEDEDDEESTKEVKKPLRRVEHADFELEELDSDPGYGSDLEVVRPDQYEDAKSEKSGIHNVLNKFNELKCDESSSDEDEQQRAYRRKKKRWSAGIFKRSHSKSIEGNSSSDNDALDDNDSTARRLRRRVRGPGDRTSLIFEDRGFPNRNNILEVDEEEDGGVPHSQGPPSIPSDDGFTLDELPFWYVDDDMDVESV